MGVHKDRGDLKKGEEEIRNSTVVSAIKRDAIYLNKKWVTKKYLLEITSKELS